MAVQLDLISSAEASPAKTSPSPATVKASKARPAPGSGGSSGGSSGSYGPSLFSSKMSLAAGGAGCPSCGAPCGASAMPACRFECPPTKLAPLMSEPESSYWPTPTAAQYGYNRGGRARREGPVRQSLYSMARSRALWPTATAGDAKASGSRNKDGSGANQGTSLTDAILRGGSSHQGRPQSMAGMVLNPRFVERLLGLPDDWTLPDSRRWGTQLSLMPPPAPGGS